MAVMQLSPEQERHAVVEPALVGNSPGGEFQAVRHITPLVMSILMAVNNPYVSGKTGYDALGVPLDNEGRPAIPPAQFAMVMMPKTAEVLVLLTCDRDTLKRYAVNLDALRGASLDVMEDADIDMMVKAAEFVADQMISMAKARAVVSDDEEKPSAKALAERDIKKKQHRTG